MGITEKAFFKLKDEYKVLVSNEFIFINDLAFYQEKNSEGTLVNLLGLSIIIFTVLVLGLVSKQSFKRLNR